MAIDQVKLDWAVVDQEGWQVAGGVAGGCPNAAVMYVAILEKVWPWLEAGAMASVSLIPSNFWVAVLIWLPDTDVYCAQ
jgi:hypothetical protein